MKGSSHGYVLCVCISVLCTIVLQSDSAVDERCCFGQREEVGSLLTMQTRDKAPALKNDGNANWSVLLFVDRKECFCVNRGASSAPCAGQREKCQKLTAPGIPRRSPIQVLTRPNPA